MPWWEYALLGMGGGAIVEVLAFFRCVTVWQQARQNRDGTLKRTPPDLRRYVDISAHLIMLPCRALLGAVAAVLFGTTGQVTGLYGAVAFGCAAPVMLAQLGLLPHIDKVVRGVPAPRKPKADLPVAGDPLPEESRL
jgi:hypothetical protein